MSDADLEEIRKARLAQLQQQGGGGGNGGSGGGQEDQRKYETHLEPLAVPLTDFPFTDNKRVNHFRNPSKIPLRTSAAGLTLSVADARTSILAQILLPEAADRLGRIRLVKESRAVDVENRLIVLARSGQLRSKVTEEQLKELLGAVAETNEKDGGTAGKIVISRRKGGWDDDDDVLLDL